MADMARDTFAHAFSIRFGMSRASIQRIPLKA
jgi:hypothetical protein